jgi:nucleoid DNA-binding protein
MLRTGRDPRTAEGLNINAVKMPAFKAVINHGKK